MTATSRLDSLRQRATTTRNVTIYVAILIAVPTAYAFHVWSGTEGGDFLLLMMLAIGVPTAFDEYKTAVEDHWRAVAWVLGACLIVTIEYTGVYVIGTETLSLSAFWASLGAFLLVWAMNHAYLVVRSRASD